ncbi:MAG: hypothetical protein ABI114_04375 [Rhodanobacter sp.]
MKLPGQLSTLMVSLAAVLALSACGKADDPAAAGSAMVASTTGASTAPVSIIAVDLGSTVGADKNVEAVGESFAPTDHIYATVATSGAGEARLGVKWVDEAGKTLKEDSKTITGAGRDMTTFEMDKPEGLPTGNFKLAVSLNGTAGISKSFVVR